MRKNMNTDKDKGNPAVPPLSTRGQHRVTELFNLCKNNCMFVCKFQLSSANLGPGSADPDTRCTLTRSIEAIV